MRPAEKEVKGMRIACLQMDMKLGSPEENFAHAQDLIRAAMQKAEKPDVLVLPETWNTGFFPKENLRGLSCNDGDAVKARIGALARELQVNIVAGSVSNARGERVFNTAMVFDRQGACIARYDKTHLFTPMGEHDYYTPGNSLCRFALDGAACGLILCYDLRFPELIRSLSLMGLDVLFVPAQWPKQRIFHLRTLVAARAIENQMFVVCCNSCGTAGETVFGGNSAIVDPLGETLALAGESEAVASAVCDLQMLAGIRDSIPVLRDRRPELYRVAETRG